MKYMAKGSMCKKCKFQGQSCADLPFHLYQVYEVHDNYTVVICHEYCEVKDGR